MDFLFPFIFFYFSWKNHRCCQTFERSCYCWIFLSLSPSTPSTLSDSLSNLMFGFVRCLNIFYNPTSSHAFIDFRTSFRPSLLDCQLLWLRTFPLKFLIFFYWLYELVRFHHCDFQNQSGNGRCSWRFSRQFALSFSWSYPWYCIRASIHSNLDNGRIPYDIAVFFYL